MTLQRQNDERGSEVIAALERAWQAIRRTHPDLPTAVIVTGAGSTGRPHGLRFGHFAAQRWQTSDRQAVAEVFIGGEGLQRGVRAVLATELHEAAHALAHIRQIRDTSRQGRYHNHRFKALAEEVGLRVDHHPTLGWSVTTLPTSTAQRYAPALAHLEGVLTAHRAREPSPVAAHSNVRAYACPCGRRIRVAPRTYAQAPITCGACRQPFREPPATDPSSRG